MPPEQAGEFVAGAEAAMEILRGKDGFETGTVGRSTDEAGLWVVVTAWRDVGSFRRAISAFDVKVGAVPLLATAVDEATAFERLVLADPDTLVRRGSDRAADADWAGPSHG